MGDLESDIYMARGVNYETILSIFYAKEGDTDQRAYAEEKFDLIVEGDGSHKIVVELIKIIKGKKNINWEYLSSVHPNLHEYLVWSRSPNLTIAHICDMQKNSSEMNE